MLRVLLFTLPLACLGADLTLPIHGLTARDIRNTFKQGRANGQPHEAVDLLALRGTPVLAVAAGVIQKLFLSKPGGITIYEFDPQGEYCYYYAHWSATPKDSTKACR